MRWRSRFASARHERTTRRWSQARNGPDRGARVGRARRSPARPAGHPRPGRRRGGSAGRARRAGRHGRGSGRRMPPGRRSRAASTRSSVHRSVSVAPVGARSGHYGGGAGWCSILVGGRPFRQAAACGPPSHLGRREPERGLADGQLDAAIARRLGRRRPAPRPQLAARSRVGGCPPSRPTRSCADADASCSSGAGRGGRRRPRIPCQHRPDRPGVVYVLTDSRQALPQPREPRCGIRPHPEQCAAVPIPPQPRLVDDVLLPGAPRPQPSETLVERDVDGVEQRRDLRVRAVVERLASQSRAPSMCTAAPRSRAPAPARPGRPTPGAGRRSRAAAAREQGGQRLRDRLEVLERQPVSGCRPSWRQAVQALVALVSRSARWLVGWTATRAAPAVGVDAQRDLLGHRPARQERPAGLPSSSGTSPLERPHRAARAVEVGPELVPADSTSSSLRRSGTVRKPWPCNARSQASRSSRRSALEMVSDVSPTPRSYGSTRGAGASDLGRVR